MTSEHQISCGAPAGQKSEGELALRIDGTSIAAELKVSHLRRHFLKEMPDILADILELSAYVYAADSAIPRGGSIASQMGKAWRRNLHFEIPVRCRETWEDPKVDRLLVETLSFLSEDSYAFTFRDHDGTPIETVIPFLDFGEEDPSPPDEVIMFSGGLDSLAGALDALVDRHKRVALVSHSSAATMTRTQRELAAILRERTGPDRVRHVSVQARMRGRSLKEGTHRARSFLFAAMGMVVARSFGRDRVDFCENGIVSLNLPLLAQHVGTRATRSTHPQALAGLSDLFSRLLATEATVGNPLFWKTKTDVLHRIEDLGFGDLIAHTMSCANVRSSSRMTPHCGRCSQCIDRRFAVMAAGLEVADPKEAYDVDLLSGPRIRDDRELALAYVRNARRFRAVTASGLMRSYPEVVRAVRNLGIEPTASLERLASLYNRHGRAVINVMESALARPERPAESLLALYASMDSAPDAIPVETSPRPPEKLLIELDEDRQRARLNGSHMLENTRFQTLSIFVASYLDCLGRALDPQDFEAIPAERLRELWNLDDGAVVRRRISALRKIFVSVLGEAGSEILETLPWHGYRLRPEAVVIRKVDLGPTPKPQLSS